MSQWFQRLFGDTDQFAIRVTLWTDPHPAEGLDPAEVLSWGTFELWFHGRCLTRSVQPDGEYADGVSWYLLPFLEWSLETALWLLNEEALPRAVQAEVSNACEWLDVSQEPGHSLSLADEEAFFVARSDWRRRHSLREGFPGAAFPMVLMRRVGNVHELSWDNETWGTTRPHLRFTEPCGAGFVDVTVTGSVIATMLRDVCAALREKADHPRLRSLEESVDKILAAPVARTQLLHPDTSTLLEKSFPEVAARLAASTSFLEAPLVGAHSLETWALRGLRATHPAHLEPLLSALDALRTGVGLRGVIADARRPTPPDTRSPWREGYERALELRDDLGWGVDPAPNIPDWLRQHGVAYEERSLGPLADVLVVNGDGHQPLIVANPQTARKRHFEMASGSGLGHVLMDADTVVMDGPMEFWPSAARARAFAAMLAMPEDGVRECFDEGNGEPIAGTKNVMSRYHTSAKSATWHVRNLGFMSDAIREEVLEALLVERHGG